MVSQVALKPVSGTSTITFGRSGFLMSTVNPLNIAPIPRSQSESDLKEATSLFTSASREDPAFSTAQFNLRPGEPTTGDERSSIAAYKRAIEIDPAFVDARVQYAAVLIENSDPDQAIRQLTDAIRLAEGSDEVYSLMARACEMVY